MLDLKLSANLSNHNTVEVSPIIGDDPFGDAISIDKVMLDETGHNILVTEANEALQPIL